MRTFLQMGLVLSLALLVVACGGKASNGDSASGSGAAGTYKLDNKNIKEAIIEMAKKSMPMDWDKMPEEVRTQTMEQVDKQAAQMSMSLVLKDDGTFVVKGKFGEDPMTASGTYKVDGEKLTVTTTEKDGKNEDKPETVMGKLKNGVITLRPDKDMPFDLVLVKE